MGYPLPSYGPSWYHPGLHIMYNSYIHLLINPPHFQFLTIFILTIWWLFAGLTLSWVRFTGPPEASFASELHSFYLTMLYHSFPQDLCMHIKYLCSLFISLNTFLENLTRVHLQLLHALLNFISHSYYLHCPFICMYHPCIYLSDP